MDPTWVSESVNGSVSRSTVGTNSANHSLRLLYSKWSESLQFTHTFVFSALLLTLAFSRFLVPDSPLLVPAPFLSSAPLYGMASPSSLTETLPGLFKSNLETSPPQKKKSKKKIDLPCFLFRAAVFLRLKSLFVVRLNCV